MLIDNVSSAGISIDSSATIPWNTNLPNVEKANETLVEWLESKDKWNKNRASILHIGRLEEIFDGEEFTVN